MRSIHVNPRNEFLDNLSSIVDAQHAADKKKLSLKYADAGKQIARGDITWNGTKVTGKPAALTHGFYSKKPDDMPTKISGFQSLSAGQRDAIRKSLASWSDVARVSFKEAPLDSGSKPNLKLCGFSKSGDGPYAFAYSPKASGGARAGDAWFDVTSQNIASKIGLHGYGRLTFAHEIGHTLGLHHPGSYNAGRGKKLNYGVNAEYAQDSYGYSIMSSFSEHNTYQDFNGHYPSAPMLHDISAIQHLYGANMQTRKGNTIYDFNSNADRDFFKAKVATDVLVFSVWDAGGYNTFNFSGYKQAQKIDLHQGAFSNVGGLKGNVSIAMGTHIHRAIGGTGNDLIIGNNDKNLLEGNRGNNTFIGGPKGDVFVGGPGRNKYVYTHIRDSTPKDPDVIKDFKTGRDKLDFSALKSSKVTKTKVTVVHHKNHTEDAMNKAFDIH